MKKKLLMTIALCVSMAFGGCVLPPETSESMGAGTSLSENSTSSSTDLDGDSSLNSSDDLDSDSSAEVIVNDEMSVHFLELGNKYTGDCTLIKVGDTEEIGRAHV